MKKFLLVLGVFALNLSSLSAQDQLVWNQVGIEVNDGYGSDLVDLLDSFYGSIDLPEGVSISLTQVYHSDEEHKATHYLTFSGTAAGLTELRQLRSGAEYDNYSTNFSKYGQTISNSIGSSVIRLNTDSTDGNIAQVWEWRVEDVFAFVDAFNRMTSVWSPDGYLSLGAITGGQSVEGESHYVYTTYSGYQEMLEFGPKTEEEQAAFFNFIKETDAYSEFKGTFSMFNVKSWN
jgi:hypothetical protein